MEPSTKNGLFIATFRLPTINTNTYNQASGVIGNLESLTTGPDQLSTAIIRTSCSWKTWKDLYSCRPRAKWSSALTSSDLEKRLFMHCTSVHEEASPMGWLTTPRIIPIGAAGSCDDQAVCTLPSETRTFECNLFHCTVVLECFARSSICLLSKREDNVCRNIRWLTQRQLTEREGLMDTAQSVHRHGKQ
jgi:hypothetical protein